MEVDRNKRVSIAPPESKKTESFFVLHSHMVKNFCYKLRFFISCFCIKSVINDKDIVPFFVGKFSHKTVCNHFGKHGGKTEPVCFCGTKETVDRILGKGSLEISGLDLHIHAPVRKDQAEKKTENLKGRSSFFLFSTAYP